jgi:uncharacterized protein (DUF1330 family)
MSDKIYMLNALWFKPDGGAEKYAEYGAAAEPFVQALGGKMIDGYQPQQSLIGEWDPDLFFLVEWPDWDSFTKLAADPGYQKIAHLREEALDKSLLIQCAKLPGNA